MNIIEAILLGAVQGATEFLPISSSGHLLLVPSLFNLDEPDLNTVAIAHLGTLLAVLVYFRRDLWQISLAVIDGLRRRQPMSSDDSRLGWYIALGTLPAVIAGLLLADFLDEIFGNPTAAGFFLLVTAAILVVGERLLTGLKTIAGLSGLDALAVGVAQAVALLPGISRSGITISAGLGRGLDRPAAARFSFLLGVPAIAAAGALALLDLAQSPDIANQLLLLAITFLSAAIIGFACIHFLLTWLRQHTLYPFAIYCAAFGTFYLLVAWLR